MVGFGTVPAGGSTTVNWQQAYQDKLKQLLQATSSSNARQALNAVQAGAGAHPSQITGTYAASHASPASTPRISAGQTIQPASRTPQATAQSLMNSKDISGLQNVAATAKTDMTVAGPPTNGGRFGVANINGDNSWLNGQSESNWMQYINDPSMAADMYGSKNKLSDAEIASLQGWVDPSYQYILSQGSSGANPSARDEAAFYGGIFNQGTQGMETASPWNPGQIMAQILSAPLVDPDNGNKSALSQNMYGSGADPQSQVKGLLTFAQGALRGIVPDAQLGSYLNMLQTMGQKYIEWSNSTANTGKNSSFGLWLQNRLGPTGGI